jgi:hypothetical protein
VPIEVEVRLRPPDSLRHQLCFGLSSVLSLIVEVC